MNQDSRVLIRTYEGHIHGYSFISDLEGDTRLGISVEETEKYDGLDSEFEEDSNLERYLGIPRGTLKVYGLMDTYDAGAGL